MAAFADLIDLQTAVVELVKDASIVDVFPRLVQLAEVNFNQRLRCFDQITNVTVTISSGLATLPSNFIEMIGLYNASGYEYVQQPLQSVKLSTATHFYAIAGTSLVTKIADGDLSADYYAQVPTLTTSNTTSNWLLAKYPGIYLYGVGVEAAKYLQKANVAVALAQVLEMEFTAAEGCDTRSRYSRARVRVAGVTP